MVDYRRLIVSRWITNACCPPPSLNNEQQDNTTESFIVVLSSPDLDRDTFLLCSFCCSFSCVSLTRWPTSPIWSNIVPTIVMLWYIWSWSVLSLDELFSASYGMCKCTFSVFKSVLPLSLIRPRLDALNTLYSNKLCNVRQRCKKFFRGKAGNFFFKGSFSKPFSDEDLFSVLTSENWNKLFSSEKYVPKVLCWDISAEEDGQGIRKLGRHKYHRRFARI